MIDEKPMILYTNFLNLREGDRTVPIADKLVPQSNLLIEAVKVLGAIHFVSRQTGKQVYSIFSA
jgi:hypothetical protein